MVQHYGAIRTYFIFTGVAILCFSISRLIGSCRFCKCSQSFATLRTRAVIFRFFYFLLIQFQFTLILMTFNKYAKNRPKYHITWFSLTVIALLPLSLKKQLKAIELEIMRVNRFSFKLVRRLRCFVNLLVKLMIILKCRHIPTQIRTLWNHVNSFAQKLNILPGTVYHFQKGIDKH